MLEYNEYHLVAEFCRSYPAGYGSSFFSHQRVGLACDAADLIKNDRSVVEFG